MIKTLEKVFNVQKGANVYKIPVKASFIYIKVIVLVLGNSQVQ